MSFKPSVKVDCAGGPGIGEMKALEGTAWKEVAKVGSSARESFIICLQLPGRTLLRFPFEKADASIGFYGTIADLTYTLHVKLRQGVSHKVDIKFKDLEDFQVFEFLAKKATESGVIDSEWNMRCRLE